MDILRFLYTVRSLCMLRLLQVLWVRVLFAQHWFLKTRTAEEQDGCDGAEEALDLGDATTGRIGGLDLGFMNEPQAPWQSSPSSSCTTTVDLETALLNQATGVE